MARRSLLDLYVRGKAIEIDDGNGESVKVWLQKLNPVDHAAAVRAADAARARVLSVKNAKDSDEYMAIYADILAAEREAMVGILVAIERSRIQPLSDAEKAAEDEWSEDNYLTGLRDAWDGGLRDKYLDDPEDPETKRVYDELTRFLAQVKEDVDDKVSVHEDGLNAMTDAELRQLLFDHNIKVSSDFAWMNEYYRQEMFRSTRDSKNHKDRIFESRSDVDELQIETYQVLHQGLRELNVEPLEGKDSAAQPPSSTSSEQSGQEETAESSGQKAVSQ
jgi:predicted  nucleic acid-binding Zn-ribbon protein